LDGKGALAGAEECVIFPLDAAKTGIRYRESGFLRRFAPESCKFAGVEHGNRRRV
jgi:hypothetical protein